MRNIAGVTLDYIGGACPVQAEGLADGVPFYFRARHDEWQMHIGSDTEASSADLGVHGFDVIGNPKWYFEGDHDDAGWMSDEDALTIIGRTVAQWRQMRAPSPK